MFVLLLGAPPPVVGHDGVTGWDECGSAFPLPFTPPHPFFFVLILLVTPVSAAKSAESAVFGLRVFTVEGGGTSTTLHGPPLPIHFQFQVQAVTTSS